MVRTLRFAASLVVGLALVTGVASLIVHRTTTNWFEKDVRLRSQLAVNGARQGLIVHWNEEQPQDLQKILLEITRDERIMAAAACAPDLTLLTKTPEFPDAFTARKSVKTFARRQTRVLVSGRSGMMSNRFRGATCI